MHQCLITMSPETAGRDPVARTTKRTPRRRARGVHGHDVACGWLTRCHLRRPPAVAGPSVGAGLVGEPGSTPTTGGLWFLAVTVRDAERARPNRGRTADLRRSGGFGRIRHPRLDGAAMSGVDHHWTPSSERARAGRRPAAGRATTPAAQVWPTGFDLLDQTWPAASARASWCCSAARRAWARPPGRSRWPATSPGPAGRVVFFASSTTRETLLVRLVALEAGQLGGIERARRSNRIRQRSRRRRPRRLARRAAPGHRSAASRPLEVVAGVRRPAGPAPLHRQQAPPSKVITGRGRPGAWTGPGSPRWWSWTTCRRCAA